MLGFTLGSMASFAQEIKMDLSGTWQYIISQSENKACIGTYDLMFVPTTFKSQTGEPLYLVDGEICHDKIWGASLETFGNEQHLVWYLLRSKEFDSESNMILQSSTASMSLGGDFEKYEVATMIKTGDIE